jgi:hypothetical protein
MGLHIVHRADVNLGGASLLERRRHLSAILRRVGAAAAAAAAERCGGQLAAGLDCVERLSGGPAIKQACPAGAHIMQQDISCT